MYLAITAEEQLAMALSPQLSDGPLPHRLPLLPSFVSRGVVLLPSRRPFLRPIVCSAKKNGASFTDRILDYIEGGPKLRKWYGAAEMLPKDGDAEAADDGDREKDEVRDAVLVTNGDSEIGQMVILSLIVKRVQIKALVKNKQATINAFGDYVEPIVGEASSKLFLKKAMRGIRAIICPSNEGFLSDVGQLKGVEHIVLLSQSAAYKGSGGFQALLNDKARKLAERDEGVVVSSGIPYTIIRAALLQNKPGGNRGFSFKKGVAATGKLSKENAALICVEALDTIPQNGLIFEVANGEEKVSDWRKRFASFVSKQEE